MAMALPVGSRTDWDDGDEQGGDEEWEICNDNGFVYKRRRPSDNDGGHLRSPPPSSSRACEAKTRRARKKKTLLSLRDKYQKELDQWQQLSASLAQVPPTATGPTEVPSTEAATSPAPPPSISLEIDELLLQVCLLDCQLGFCFKFQTLRHLGVITVTCLVVDA